MNDLDAPAAVCSIPTDPTDGQFIGRIAERLNAPFGAGPNGASSATTESESLDDLSYTVGGVVAAAHVDFEHAVKLPSEIQVVLLVGNPVRKGDGELLLHLVAAQVRQRR
jgi:hypothetical protein